jgi:hypothetical protein
LRLHSPVETSQKLTTITILRRILLSKLGLGLVDELLFSVVLVLELGGLVLCEDGLLVCEAVEDAEDQGAVAEDLCCVSVSDGPSSAIALSLNGWHGAARGNCREGAYVCPRGGHGGGVEG